MARLVAREELVQQAQMSAGAAVVLSDRVQQLFTAVENWVVALSQAERRKEGFAKPKTTFIVVFALLLHSCFYLPPLYLLLLLS